MFLTQESDNDRTFTWYGLIVALESRCTMEGGHRKIGERATASSFLLILLPLESGRFVEQELHVIHALTAYTLTLVTAGPDLGVGGRATGNSRSQGDKFLVLF